MTLDVYDKKSIIGKVDISQEGLYYRVKCRCHLPKEKQYVFCLATEKEELSLGICIPVSEEFGINTRFPQKKLPGTVIKAFIRPKEQEKTRVFIPLEVGKPFPDIRQLMKYRIGLEAGQIGVYIRDL